MSGSNCIILITNIYSLVILNKLYHKNNTLNPKPEGREMLLLDGKCVKERDVGKRHYMGQHVAKAERERSGERDSRVSLPMMHTPQARINVFQRVVLVLGLQILVKFDSRMGGILRSRVGSLAIHGGEGKWQAGSHQLKTGQEPGSKLAEIFNGVSGIKMEGKCLHS